MPTINMKLYHVLRELNVEQDKAEEAAQIDDVLVTKDFLKAELSKLKVEIILWNIATIIAVAGIVAAIFT